MNISIVIDWKFVGALGLGGIGFYLVSKIDPADAKEAFNHAVDACKEVAIACPSLFISMITLIV